MASAAQNLRSRGAGYAIDGSLAYDLDWAARERELRHAGEAPRRREAVKEEIKSVSKPRVRVRERQRVSPVSVLGVAAVLGMAFLLLLSCIQLTVLASDTVALKKQLETLEAEEVSLTAQYEQMFDLTTVRKAAEAAGMRKPAASQICYLDLTGGDSVVVYESEEASVIGELLDSLSHGVYSVVEYFE